MTFETNAISITASIHALYSIIFWYAHVFFCLFYSKAQQDVKEPHVLIVKQPKQRYGEEIKMANQFVMLVVFITNCTM